MEVDGSQWNSMELNGSKWYSMKEKDKETMRSNAKKCFKDNFDINKSIERFLELCLQ